MHFLPLIRRISPLTVVVHYWWNLIINHLPLMAATKVTGLQVPHQHKLKMHMVRQVSMLLIGLLKRFHWMS